MKGPEMWRMELNQEDTRWETPLKALKLFLYGESPFKHYTMLARGGESKDQGGGGGFSLIPSEGLKSLRPPTNIWPVLLSITHLQSLCRLPRASLP